MSNIGMQVRSIRLKNNLSQRELSEASGVHFNTILNFENGKRSPSVDNFISLANAMGYELVLRRKPKTNC